MRGKAHWLRAGLLERRITPAYAGKRYNIKAIYGTKQGSPPPMRGKVDSMYEVGFQSRITPAYAGKRSCWSLGTCRHGDHPRLCGEKVLWNAVHAVNQGSPPPMRGKD